MTKEELIAKMAASAGITIEDGCGTMYAAELIEDTGIVERLDRIEMALGEMYAAHLRSMSNET